MARTFAQYARERETKMSPEARELGRAFDAAAEFGRVIRGTRAERKLSQSGLADLSGIQKLEISPGPRPWR